MTHRPVRAAAVICAAVLAVTLTGPPAHAASGSVTDPKGDFPDIVKLAYANRASSVRMTMTYADAAEAQNESFYLLWGRKRYQVFESRSAGLRELRYYRSGTAAPKAVSCDGLKVVHQDARDATKVVIPRACIPKAADTLKFQGIATAGLSLVDETRKSPRTRRG
jgi:hypothetical protein